MKRPEADLTYYETIHELPADFLLARGPWVWGCIHSSAFPLNIISESHINVKREFLTLPIKGIMLIMSSLGPDTILESFIVTVRL
ncbi:hypothetical protein NPIL_55721 [Nephila pilipes]|uniref:Uncharacterized protein n=1 Tax=Nephila pilipes TaxID=299642 RepID=A0A8X6QHN8_NEPPI|nr:hypothetical protein NPIL_55721 [Nephila pilipes]